jgi:maltose/glucose-specific phosphotransferase system IIC component/glucose-specific phosphotransferase system IIA component
MKDKIFGVLQRVGRSFMLPIALLPVAGLLLGIGGSFSNQTMIEAYHLTDVMGPGTISYTIFVIMADAGQIVFANLPILFAMGVAIGMAKKEKAVAALAGVIAYMVMHTVIGSLIYITQTYDPASLQATNDALQMAAMKAGTEFVPVVAERMLPAGSITTTLGIQSLQMGVFGGILVGLGVAALHNRYYNIELPTVVSFFGGTRFVPIISALVYLGVGAVMFFIWPYVQMGINALGNLVIQSGYVGTFAYGLIERALIPFGLHHVFYLPFWQTALGGTMMVDGKMIEGAQNIFFAQLASGDVAHFSVDATRFMSGKYPFMIFGLPGAALAMYRCAKPEKRKAVGGLLLSAALTAMITGITEPIEFTFLFVAPFLYVIHCVLCGLAYTIMHILNVGVGMTFSGGIIDLFLFGILQGPAKTSWYWIPMVGAAYFVIYYFLFRFLIVKFNLKTPGREDSEEDPRLYTREDVDRKKAQKSVAEGTAAGDPISMMITQGLGGKANIVDVDCCATRLRCTVSDPEKVSKETLQGSGAAGVIFRGNGVQVIYGPRVTVIKSNLEEFLESPASDHIKSAAAPAAIACDDEAADPKSTEAEGAQGQNPQDEIFISPVDGRLAPISETPDDVFSQKMMGDGVVIFPTGSTITAPCDGTVSVLFPTKHAIGITTDAGTELLIHVGIDTVNLEGRGFESHIAQGDHVQAGDLMLTLDLPYLEANAPSTAIPMIFTDLPPAKELTVLTTGEVKAKEDIVKIRP